MTELQTKNNQGRLLVFIVAYNAEKTIESVLRRIPTELSRDFDVEVLIIDDSSQDKTFDRGELARRAGLIPFPLTVLFNPVNQGYGGNQKIGFHYAIKNGFDWVALVHGDGQYAPECLPELIKPLATGEAEAVFGSRMLEGTGALKGGMPLYKFVGNKILTSFQNLLLGSNLSEFHSGYRLYSTKALAKVPFELNNNDFHFDTEIIIQFLIARHRIMEIPIPTFYGDEVCHVNGLHYAMNVCLTTMQSKIQRYHILYDRKFDCAPEKEGEEITSQAGKELTFFEQELFKRNAHILLMGETDETLAAALEKHGHRVSMEKKGLLQTDRKDLNDIDYLVLLDDTDLAQHPEKLVKSLQSLCRYNPRVEIIFAVGNIGFILTRLNLLFGRFAYTRRGILTLKHFRLFTPRSLKKLFNQNGFTVEMVKGLAIPYQQIFASKGLSAFLTKLHNLFNRLRPSLFGYQFLVSIKPLPSLEYLLDSAVRVSEKKQTGITP